MTKYRIIPIILLLLGMAFGVEAKMSYRLEPTRIMAGEPVSLYLVNSDGELPRIDKLPAVANLTWLSSQPQVSNSVRVINGVKTAETIAVYSFVIGKAGNVTVPVFEVTAGKRRYRAGPLTLTAHSRTFTVAGKDGGAGEVKVDELIRQQVIIPGERRKFYVGEEIPLEIRIMSAVGVDFQLRSWPTADIDKVVFRDFSAVNRENRQFAPVRRFVENVDGRDYVTLAFSTAFRPISTGKLTGTITSEGAIRVREEGSRRNAQSDDPFDGWGFFGGPRVRAVPKKLETTLPALEILPLPPLPSGAVSLGLLGNWVISSELSSDTVKVGDTLTLKIKFSGVGSLDNLCAPKLEVPGFRIYPPEIDRHYNPEDNRSNGEIRYILIPTEVGTAELKLSFVYFDTVREKYRQVNVDKRIKIEKSDVLTSTDNVFVGSVPEDKDKPALTGKPPVNRSTILYLKKKPGGKVALPLPDNHLWLIIILLVAGPLLLALGELGHLRRRRLENDPVLRRRHRAAGRRSKVIKLVARSREEELDSVVRSEVVPYLNDMLGLPPGTAATELADKVHDAELSRALRDAGESGYMPGAEHLARQEMKRMIMKGLKRLGVIALAAMGFWCGPLSGAATASASGTHPLPKDNDSALTAYEKGCYADAGSYYAGLIDPHAPDPAWLYNLGNCLCQQKQYARALVCYEKAWRLAPGDSDVLENLNFVRRKLMLPEVGQIATPLELLRAGRDMMRPDQWLVVAAWGWLLLFVAVAIRRLLPRGKWGIGVVAALMLLTGIGMTIWQYQGPYRGDVAVVIDRSTVYQLPSDSAEKTDFQLRSGQQVTVVDTRSGWSRIRIDGNGEGWVKSTTIAPVWGGWSVKELETLARPRS